MNKKKGIMGGTFNPIHNGHLKMAEYAFKEGNLDEIMFLPSGHPDYKSYIRIASGEDRMEMIRLAIEDTPYFFVSDIEIQRKGNTYTYDTMSFLNKEHPDISYYYIIGADSLFQLHTWHNAKELLKMVPFLVATRDGNSMEQLTARAKELECQYGASISLLHMPNTEVSSHEIREMVEQNKSIENLVPIKVMQYIMTKGLYGGRL
ncbi:MAG: nicotinate-nucleotide adenylyltransferase [Lachnospiraceae bacterium]|nr:nicotinate-nucleotide adenylyltransferase [Lachnospiraceae bacterium]